MTNWGICVGEGGFPLEIKTFKEQPIAVGVNYWIIKWLPLSPLLWCYTTFVLSGRVYIWSIVVTWIFWCAVSRSAWFMSQVIVESRCDSSYNLKSLVWYLIHICPQKTGCVQPVPRTLHYNLLHIISLIAEKNWRVADITVTNSS